MTKYRKSPDKDLVIIPGVGRVAPGQILEGPQYARFAGLGLLEEILEEKPTGPTAAQKDAGEAAKRKAAGVARLKAIKADQDAARRKAEAEAKAAEAAEAALEGIEDETLGDQMISEDEAVSEDEPDKPEAAKMEKRAAARRKKRSSKKS
jgi:hypothetical protein